MLLWLFFGIAVSLLGVTLWNVLAWPRLPAPEETAPALVSLLIPARNEEANLAACLETVLAQGVAVSEILVYDDHSDDATPVILADYARREARVRAVPVKELPAGWGGKNFACAQLAAAATSVWLLFIDADARLEAHAVKRMLVAAQRYQATFLSCWPQLEMESFAEKLLMPLLNFLVFTLYPAPLAFQRMDESLGVAHGVCILAERAAYEAIGGHAAVKNVITEDIRLSQLWRAGGRRSFCFDGTGAARARMYQSAGEIWRGFQKNFYPGFRRELSFWLFWLLHALVFLAPFIAAPVLWLKGYAGAWSCGATAVIVLMIRAALAWRFGHPWWSALLHPLGQMFLLALGLSSWWRCRSGRGVSWKGRRLE
jgi:chlorobactene glucosyltransferase